MDFVLEEVGGRDPSDAFTHLMSMQSLSQIRISCNE